MYWTVSHFLSSVERNDLNILMIPIETTLPVSNESPNGYLIQLLITESGTLA